MIIAKIIKDSVSEFGRRITTFELEYPRFIHSELMTHRAFSRNAASSRAIPISVMLRLVWKTPATPIHWGKYQTGMTAKDELKGWRLWLAKKLWTVSGKVACGFAWLMWKVGLAKQVVNRIVEPWSHIKVIVTSTDYANWFHLRRHEAAQPEIHELADRMWEGMLLSVPTRLCSGDWHLPYVDRSPGNDGLYTSGGTTVNLDKAKKLSASLCAQVSYRKADESVETALRVYDRLVTNEPVHASPFEHQAMALRNPDEMSGNFRGWLQHRQLIPRNAKPEVSLTDKKS